MAEVTERPGGPLEERFAGGALRLRNIPGAQRRSGLAGLLGKVDGGMKMNGIRPLASPSWRLNKPEAAGACAHSRQAKVRKSFDIAEQMRNRFG